MNKSELVKLLAEKAALSKSDAELCVSTIWNSVSEALARGERVEIRGFGTFSVKNYAPRMGRNPKTGETIHLQERSLPSFKPGKQLKERLNTSRDDEE